MEPFVLKMTCIVDGCGNQHLARGYCPKHYYHARKNGFDGESPLKRMPTRTPTYCSLPGCSEKNKGHGLCKKHYARWTQRGRNPEHLTDGSLLERRRSKPSLGKKGAEAPAWKGEAAATYRQTHKRVQAAKAPAREHSCVDCGAQAKQWSYIGGDPDERNEPRPDDRTKFIRFSVNADFYQPRCVPCHVAHDRRM